MMSEIERGVDLRRVKGRVKRREKGEWRLCWRRLDGGKGKGRAGELARVPLLCRVVFRRSRSLEKWEESSGFGKERSERERKRRVAKRV